VTALGNAPAHWRRTTIGEIAEVRLGRQRSPKNHSGDQMRSYLRAANVTWYRLRLDDVAAMNFTEREMSTYALRQGDIVVVEGGTPEGVGQCALVTEQVEGMAFQNTLIRVRPHPEVDSRWLMYRLNADGELGGYRAIARGAGNIQHISASRYKNHSLAIPPLGEQHAIVETIERMLSRLDAALAAVATGQERLGGIEKAVIQRVLDRVGGHPGTRRVAWREVGSTLSGRAFPSSAYQDDGVPLVRPGNLAPTGRVVWGHSATRYLPAKFAQENHKYLIEGRALLMNLTAQSLADDFLGRVCLSSSEDRFLLNQRIAVLSSPVASADYLSWVFRSPEFRRFVASANTGSLIQHISTKALNDFAFPLPDSQGQRAVVAELEKAASTARHVGAAVTGVLPRSSLLRRSVLKAAFEGRLVDGAAPGDPVDTLVEAIA
jgi:type I restriction enzyme, S subunit